VDNDTSSIRVLQNDVAAPLPGKNPYHLLDQPARSKANP